MSEAPGSVAFDFHGSLELARRLVDLADRWERACTVRHGAVDAALSRWTGPHRDVVAQRSTVDHARSVEVAAALRDEAGRWATAWAGAVDDQNRSRWLQIASTEGGELGSPPLPVDPPLPPDFAPTSGSAG